MKRASTILPLFFAPLILFSQVLFEKTYGLPSHLESPESIVLHGDDIILAGTTALNSNGGDDVLLVKMDGDGNIIWQKNIGGEENEGAHKVIVGVDGYILGGYTKTLGNGSKDFYLLKTDFDGNVLWEKSFGTANYESCTSLTATDDGGFLLVGDADLNNDQEVDWQIIKTDGLGNEEWSIYYGGLGSDVGRFVKQLSNGNYLIGGGSGEAIDEGGRALISLDIDGNIIWELTFPGLLFEAFYDAIEVDDGDLLVSGTSGHSTMTRVDSAGNLLWDYNSNSQGTFGNEPISFHLTSPDTLLLFRSFGWITAVPYLKLDPDEGTFLTSGSIPLVGVESGISDIISIDNEYFMLGTKMEMLFGNPQGYSVHKFDQNEINQWTFTKENDYTYHDETGNKVVETFSGDYIFSGLRDYSQDTDVAILLTKTNSSGNVIWEKSFDYSLGIESLDLVITSDDHLFMMNNLNNDSLSLLKLDMDGDVVWQQYLDIEAGPSTSFEKKGIIKELPDGGFILYVQTLDEAYLIRLDENGALIFSKSALEANDMLVTAEGHYLLLTNFGFRIYDENGIFLSLHFVSHSVSGLEFEYKSIAPTANGGYWIFGFVKETDTYPYIYRNILIKTDSDGESVFSEALGNHAKFDSNIKVVVQADESILLFGSEQVPIVNVLYDYYYLRDDDCFANSFESAFIEKRAADGTYIGRESFGLDIGANLYDGIITSDGMALGLGWFYNLNSEDQYLVNLNPSEIIGLDESIRISEAQSSIYPNPGNEVLNYNLTTTSNGRLEIQLFNSIGQLVKYFIDDKTEEQIDLQINTSELPQGIYYIQSSIEGKHMTSDKWIKTSKS